MPGFEFVGFVFFVRQQEFLQDEENDRSQRQRQYHHQYQFQRLDQNRDDGGRNDDRDDKNEPEVKRSFAHGVAMASDVGGFHLNIRRIIAYAKAIATGRPTSSAAQNPARPPAAPTPATRRA